MDTVRFGEGEGEKYRESLGTYNTLGKIDSQWEFTVEGTQTGALYQPRGVGLGGRWEGGLGGKGHGCIYGLFLLMFDRKQQNSIKQLSFN